MSAALLRWVLAGLVAFHMLGGCTYGRYGRLAGPSHYALSTGPGAKVDTPSKAVQTQPQLFTKVPGEEQVINPGWLPAGAAVAVTGGALAVTVVELKERERKEVEEVLERCAQEAEAAVNFAEFKEHRRPREEDCLRVMGVDRDGTPILWAQVAGKKKHDRALQCVARELGARYPGQVLIEPRYRYFPGADRLEYVPPYKVEWLQRQGLYHELLRTFYPDVVIILDGNPFTIRAVFDLKFPCAKEYGLPDWNAYPETSVFRAYSQGELYFNALKVKPARITPKRIEYD